MKRAWQRSPVDAATHTVLRLTGAGVTRLAAAVLTVLAMMVAVVPVPGVAPVAWAATKLGPAPEHTYYPFTVDGVGWVLGPVAMDETGKYYYCVEAANMTDYRIGPTAPVHDDDKARRVAWLLDRYRDADKETHAALAIVVQRQFGKQESEWRHQMEVIGARFPGAVARAEALWNESAAHAPHTMTVERTGAVALREGSVRVRAVDADGQAIAGVPYTVTLDGPAQFDGGGKSLSRVSSVQGDEHAWTATGAGKVTVRTTYRRHTLLSMDSKQDFVIYDSAGEVRGEAVTFAVRKDFTPSVTTVTSQKVVDAGRTVTDTVTSGVSGEDSVWVPGLTLRARGYYFDGLGAELLGDRIEPKPDESTDAFRARLAKRGLEPAAYGSAEFDGVGQSVEAMAMTEPGGDTPYTVGEHGGFGTWVWAFERDDQTVAAQEYVLKDWTSAFGDATETNVNRAKVSVDSTVTEHSADPGAQLSDTITVDGFPADHGEFAGDEEFGFGPDQAYAQVSVWWAGDADDPSRDDEYRPSGALPPDREDDHHRLLGTWDYRATNGVIKVGAGAPDAHGEAVNIVAQGHGWYVFVFSFVGDDRVMPVSSRYDDAWEMVRVGEPWEPEEPQEPKEDPPAPQEPDEPLPQTGLGGSIAVFSGVAVAALAVGAVMLALIKRRSL